MLDVDVPMISAVNGPCNMHSEVPLMGDIVLASRHRVLPGLAHFPRGLVPGDGSHVIWPMLVGPNRARSMLLMGKKLGAQEAIDWGVVAEVLPQDQLVDRAWEMARELGRVHRWCCATRGSCSCRAQASIPRRAGSRACARDVCPASVLPSGRRHARTRPCVGSGTLVRLTTRRSCTLAASSRAHVVT